MESEFPDLDAYFTRHDKGGARSVWTADASLAALGRTLELARRELGFGRSEAARLAGCTRAQVLRVERGVDARLSSYLRLADVYGCRVTVHASFPEMSALWRKANLRREDERGARARERFFKRLARKRRILG
jgi:predicted transcriptional regulator